MTWILGVDLSSVAIHMAAIPLEGEVRLGRTVQLTMCEIGSTTLERADLRKNPAERIIRAGKATRVCVETLHARGIEIVYAAVEHPSGERRNAAEALLPIFGAVLASVDEFVVQAWRPREWRKAIGVAPGDCMRKDAGSEAVVRVLGVAEEEWTQEFDEHFADAIGVALAMRAFLHASEAAA